MRLVDLFTADERCCAVRLSYDEVVTIQNALHLATESGLPDGGTRKYDRMHSEFRVLNQICRGNLEYLKTTYEIEKNDGKEEL